MNGDAPEFLPDGLVTSPQRFVAGGSYVGLKTYAPNKMDVGLLLSELPCRAAGVYTTNKFVSPTVTLTRQNVAAGKVRGVFVTSGIANAGVGEQGMTDVKECLDLAADHLGIGPVNWARVRRASSAWSCRWRSSAAACPPSTSARTAATHSPAPS